MAEQPHVAIVGGGAVGAALAHYLSRREVRVTLLEKPKLVCSHLQEIIEMKLKKRLS